MMEQDKVFLCKKQGAFIKSTLFDIIESVN